MNEIMSDPDRRHYEQQLWRDWTLLVAPAYHDRINGWVLTIESITDLKWIYGGTQ